MLIAKIGSACSLGMPNPILMDWVVIAAYVMSGLYCLKCAKYGRRWFWLAIFIFVLGINKFLFLEFCVTNIIALAAKNLGLYEMRRGFQAELILILGVVAVTFVAWLGYFVKRLDKASRLAIVAFVGLLFLVTLRIVSLHQTDAILYPDILGIGVGVNWIIELGCNLCIVYAAFLKLKNTTPHD